MREFEKASVRLAIKKAEKTNNPKVGYESIDKWAERMKESNPNVKSVKRCYTRYLKKKEIEKSKVLKWSNETRQRIYDYAKESKEMGDCGEDKFCINYLIDLLENKIDMKDTLTQQNKIKVLDWINDKIKVTTSPRCIKNESWKNCVASLKYLKNMLLKIEIKED